MRGREGRGHEASSRTLRRAPLPPPSRAPCTGKHWESLAVSLTYQHHQNKKNGRKRDYTLPCALPFPSSCNTHFSSWIRLLPLLVTPHVSTFSSHPAVSIFCCELKSSADTCVILSRRYLRPSLSFAALQLCTFYFFLFYIYVLYSVLLSEFCARSSVSSRGLS